MFHNRALANVSKNDIDQYLMLAIVVFINRHSLFPQKHFGFHILQLNILNT
jgi:hypothetical protein